MEQTAEDVIAVYLDQQERELLKKQKEDQEEKDKKKKTAQEKEAQKLSKQQVFDKLAQPKDKWIKLKKLKALQQ